jgi:DNA-binding transcriptional regulator LsrR (DeoR family)
MPRIDPDDFEDGEVARIFIATTVVEARSAEAVLTAREIRYAVIAEPIGRTLFGSARNAAVFYVGVGDAGICAAVLEGAGMGAGVVRE